MSRKSHHDYRTLNAAEIVATVTKLADRIAERFPDSGLTGAAAQLLATARDTARRARALSRPYLGLRTLVFLVAAGGIALFVRILADVDWAGIVARRNDLAISETLESSVNLIVLMGAGLWFLLTLEERWKRARTQTALHELRAFAHVVDMHQLTKDPTTLLGGGPKTPSSPERAMTRFS